ncbi:MAG: MBL fold metallo-hydrolase [Proteobacteria bacterium]|nr:MBL fold metallo-hydrolase [Pseudomonadota bacterium]
MVDNIYWLGHSSFKIKYLSKVIYIDPFKLKEGEEKADIILMTHPHFDHTSEEDVKKILKDDTVLVGVEESLAKFRGNKKALKVGDKINIDNIEIFSVPAYNVDKKFHPKSNGWLGFILNLGGVKIYHTGDTDRIPEMKNIKVNIALLPVSGTYVMSADEAVQSAIDIKPDIAIPMHYGEIVGSLDDALKFKKALEGKIKVIIKEKN